MKRLTLAQARHRTGPIYYTTSHGERVTVLDWHKWGKDVLLRTTDGREWVVSRGAMLEVER